MKMISCIKECRRLSYFAIFLLENSKRRINIRRPYASFTNNSFQTKFRSVFQGRDLLVTYVQSQLTISRNKSKGRKRKYGSSADEESSDEEEEEEDEELEENREDFSEKDGEIKTMRVNSLRVDFLLKTLLGISRRKIEEHFYANKIRVNGNKLFKKSYSVQEGDEVDLIKKAEDLDANTINVGRIKILKANLDSDSNKFVLKAWRSKSVIIKNYDGTNSWKETEDLV